MAQWNLDELNKALAQNGWDVITELSGDGHNVSAYWQIQRYGKPMTFHLAFNGLDEDGVLPLEKAYACSLVEDESISLYFKKRSLENHERHAVWRRELQEFIEKVNSHFPG